MISVQIKLNNEKKIEAERLMNDLLIFAEKMLDRYGEFHPFGGYLKVTGEIIHVGLLPPSAQQISDQKRLSILTESFKSLANDTAIVTFAITTNVNISLDGSHNDAVKFFLEHRLGYCAEVFFPYIRTNNGVQIAKTIAQQGESIFLTVREIF